jgi:hypothetical protein
MSGVALYLCRFEFPVDETYMLVVMVVPWETGRIVVERSIFMNKIG